jgi:hypothetical protein
VTATDRFSLIMLALGLVAALIGWLLRTLWSGQKDATEANTRALDRLTRGVAQLDSRLSRVEGRLIR